MPCACADVTSIAQISLTTGQFWNKALLKTHVCKLRVRYALHSGPWIAKIGRERPF